MTLFLFHTVPTAHTHSSTFSTLSCSFKPHKNPLRITKTPPPRDTVIDFGKYKGKMLGTLPSTYLKWVSKNLRARDFEHWAKLADQVLKDPVYKDRLEWEFAESVLIGNNVNNVKLSGNDKNTGAVSQLLELSERFAWDNENKAAWSQVNFELLGTSKGGRIPRIFDDESEKDEEKELFKVKKKERVGMLTESEERRRKRRDDDKDLRVEINNPFPGREALLKKALNRKKFM
ncbi:hypothetical protein Pint_30586 [Pistacia integerrima]|uniref:Uncharacterized protein n=1 Tax=Pistacia integerrima TaxID=434235 RepID=A0ACC0X346_9ROSI|nr:hypothetical protein Pint_30586 [Pistacia integerrima]